jgi:hypothetical protein
MNVLQLSDSYEPWILDEKIENPFTTMTLHEMAQSSAWLGFCAYAHDLRPGQYAVFIAPDVDVKARKLTDGRLLVKNVRSRTFAGL